MSKKQKLVALTGASSTGKSKLAVEMAQYFNGEVISADSRYVYKYLDIATAKPTKQEMKGIKHHLIDICEVTENYTAGLFVKDAENIIEELAKAKKIPIVAGGTGLYFRSLSGEFDIPEVKPDEEFRQNAEKLTSEELYSELLKKSPELAEKIHPNNKRKIIRALEIANSGEILKSKDSPYDILWIRLDATERQFLYDNSDKRVDEMVKNGLFDECKFLYKKYGENNILLNTIGIKELIPYINEQYLPESAIEEIKKNTRHYIKRQSSWFNGDKNSNIIYIDNGTDVTKEAFNLIENFLSN